VVSVRDPLLRASNVSPDEGIGYYFGDHSLKLQGSIGIVALHGLSGLYSDRIDTVPYILHTFDRVLRTTQLDQNVKERAYCRPKRLTG